MTPTHLDRPDLGASDVGRTYGYQTACGLSGSRRPTERRPTPTEDHCPPLTTNPDEVTCGSCRRSVYFRERTTPPIRRLIISRHGARILAENAVRDGQAETERDHLLLVMARCPFCEGTRVQVTTESALVDDLTSHILEAHRGGDVK